MGNGIPVRRIRDFAAPAICALLLVSCVIGGVGTGSASPAARGPEASAPGAPAAAPASSSEAAAPGSPAPASAAPAIPPTDPSAELPAAARLQLREASDLTPGYGPVTAQAWRRDGATLLTADFDRVQRWDAPGARNLGAIAGTGGLIVDFSLFEPVSGKARLAVAARDGTTTVRDADDGSRLASVSVDADATAWSPDGSALAVCLTDGRVLVLAWPGLNTSAELPAAPGRAPLRAAWLPSGRELVLGGATGVPSRWRPGEPAARPLGSGPAAGSAEAGEADGGAAGTDAGKPAVLALAVSPDGSRVAAAGSDGTVTVLDLASGAAVLRFQAHRGAALSVAWSPDGSKLATGGQDRQVRVWAAADGSPYAMQHHNSLPVRSVAWRPGGSFLSSGAGSMDLSAHTGATILWELP